MKAIRILAAAAVALAAITACSKDDPYYGPEGGGSQDPAIDKNTVLINVTQDKWAYSDQENNNYYFATIDMPEITKDVFKYGIVQMYRTFNFGQSDASQMGMPYVRLNEAPVETEDGELYWVFFTETVDYEFQEGVMYIYYTASDFDYELNKKFVPEAMQFRCVIMN